MEAVENEQAGFESEAAEPVKRKPGRPRKVRTPGDTPDAEAGTAASQDVASAPSGAAAPGTPYIHTHSSEVDRASLTHPVLCADGWLLPPDR